MNLETMRTAYQSLGYKKKDITDLTRLSYCAVNNFLEGGYGTSRGTLTVLKLALKDLLAKDKESTLARLRLIEQIEKRMRETD